MFLPYNNGLSATAESVITSNQDGKNYITQITDFQIVNGGQTTASLFHTEKKFKADLSNIYVQMKLTVIKDVEKKNIEDIFQTEFSNEKTDSSIIGKIFDAKEMVNESVLKKGKLFDCNVPLSEGSKYPQSKVDVLKLVPQKGYWRENQPYQYLHRQTHLEKPSGY